MDWASRHVLSWRLSNTMDSAFCIEALDAALHLGVPEIFNTDQGSQFTSVAFTARLLAAGARCSMDGRGRYLDNIFVERLKAPGRVGGGRPQTPAEFLDRFDDAADREAARQLLDTAVEHGGTFQGTRRLSIQASCRLWRNRITVAWLTPPAGPGPLQNENHFVFGLFAEGRRLNEMPEELIDRLLVWRSRFEARDGFKEIRDPFNNTRPHDYGFVPCYATTYADARDQLDFLKRELGTVLDDLSKL